MILLVALNTEIYKALDVLYQGVGIWCLRIATIWLCVNDGGCMSDLSSWQQS